MSEMTAFEDAFDSVAKAAGLATGLEDDARQVITPEVQRASLGGEVSVVVKDGQLSELIMKPVWFADANSKDAAEMIIAVANQALTDWAEQSIAALREATPDVKELYAALDEARNGLDSAWASTLSQVRDI